ncbi:hypothetical protein [Fulvivirga sp.]|uniref:hypothetical protein n=1 Tax=Fulvivirga sp. TaxID=1931237 RepID=UPI0032EC63B3
MKMLLISITILAFSSNSHSQSEKGTLQIDSEPGGIIEAKQLTKGSRIGSFYYSPEWARGNVQLSQSRLLSNQILRYDTYNNTIELKSIKTNRVLLLLCNDVISFDMTDSSGFNHKFINSNKFPSIEEKNARSLDGFFEILVDDEFIKLLSKTTTSILKSNYNMALGVGEKNDAVIKTESFYIFRNNSLLEVPKRKRVFLEYFSSEENKLAEFMNEEKLRVTDKEDLIKLVKFLTPNDLSRNQ